MSDQEVVKLYGIWFSPFSWRVEIALKLKGIPYEFVEEDLQNKSPTLLQYNPIHKKVPVLVHNEKPIVESHVILEYIDETWQGYPIMPRDPYDRAMARYWAKVLDDKYMSSVLNATWGPKEEQGKAFEEAHEYLSFVEKELEGKKFFGGEEIGFVDLAASFIACWVGVFQEATQKEFLTKEKYPCLSRWIEDFTSCSIVKENMPPQDRLIAASKMRVEALKAAE